MTARIAPQPATLDNDVLSKQKQEFERWRVAVAIIRHLREAGIVANCLTGKTATEAAISHCDYLRVATVNDISSGVVAGMRGATRSHRNGTAR